MAQLRRFHGSKALFAPAEWEEQGGVLRQSCDMQSASLRTHEMGQRTSPTSTLGVRMYKQVSQCVLGRQAITSQEQRMVPTI